MNPLKNLFKKVFESTPAEGASPPREDTAFEWNPDEETVAPTSAQSTSRKRGDAPAEEAPWRTAGMQAEGLRAEEAVVRARQELDAFVTEKRAEVEKLRREITEAEERFCELQERRRSHAPSPQGA